MDTTWQRYLTLASGFGEVTRKHAESVVKALVKHGEVAADRTERVVDDLLERSEANRKLIAAVVRSETERAVGRLGLVQQSELEELRAQVQALRAEVTRTQGGAPASPAARKPAQKRAKKAAPRSSAARSAASDVSEQP